MKKTRIVEWTITREITYALQECQKERTNKQGQGKKS